MNLSLDSDIYEPNIDDKGNYADYLPQSSKFTNGLRCPCGARKDHIFDSRNSFSAHIRTKTHQKWIRQHGAMGMTPATQLVRL
jgi:hypothetical protein